jgi:putative transcriptional regulator
VKTTSRFKVLLAEKEVRERRTFTLSDVAKETGISIYTVTGFANNTLKEFPRDAITKLCAFFGCTTGELLEYSPGDIRTPGHAALDLVPA